MGSPSLGLWALLCCSTVTGSGSVLATGHVQRWRMDTIALSGTSSVEVVSFTVNGDRGLTFDSVSCQTADGGPAGGVEFGRNRTTPGGALITGANVWDIMPGGSKEAFG